MMFLHVAVSIPVVGNSSDVACFGCCCSVIDGVGAVIVVASRAVASRAVVCYCAFLAGFLFETVHLFV